MGDEWYNPSTGILYKRIASSLGVQWINISGLGSTSTSTSTSTSSSASVSAAFDQANTATIIANAAFNKANTSSGGGSTIDPFMLAGM